MPGHDAAVAALEEQLRAAARESGARALSTWLPMMFAGAELASLAKVPPPPPPVLCSAVLVVMMCHHSGAIPPD
eukprot:COSAG01_NODE_123_length_25210_cov_348.799434_7_plen_74_part_00